MSRRLITPLQRKAACFGVFAVVSLAALLVLANTMMNSVPGHTSTYRADFTSISGLRPGDDVRAAGVKVGRVDAIGLTADHHASVRFRLSSAQPVTSTTTIVVRYQNLLGQRYLALQRGDKAGHVLAAGTTVPVSRTAPGFDLTALLNGFEPLFSSLEPDQVNLLSASIIAVLQGQGGTIDDLLQQTATFTEHLADKDAVIGEVVDGLTPVLQDLAARDGQVDTTVTALRDLMKKLASERGAIGDSIDDVSSLARATSSLLQAARPDVARDVKALRGTSEMIVRNRDEIDKVLTTLPNVTDAFSRPMSFGTWLNIYLCNLGIKVGPVPIAFGGPNGPYSQVCR